MGCVVEFSNPMMRFKFSSRPCKQKMLVDALLQYGNLDLTDLATVLDLPADALRSIYDGTRFLYGKQAENLIKLFLVLFGD